MKASAYIFVALKVTTDKIYELEWKNHFLNVIFIYILKPCSLQ